MTAQVPTNEPLELRAGTTWVWTRSLSDYPASTWTLKYWFKKRGSSGANFSIQATADGDTHSVSVSATTTAAYTAGTYDWVAQVSSGGEVYDVDRGSLVLQPRYDQAANLDDRTHAQKMLDAIEALLENRSTLDQQEYTINNRSLKRLTVEELMKWRDYYRAQVFAAKSNERRRNGYGGGRIVGKL